ncbi:MAG: site-specific integrase, partial [Burkholderiaceae bacterium]
MTSAAVDGFLSELSTRRASQHTLAAYRADLDKLVELADDKAFAALSAHDIRRFVAKLHSMGLAPSSIARTLST